MFPLFNLKVSSGFMLGASSLPDSTHSISAGWTIIKIGTTYGVRLLRLTSGY